MHHGENRRDGFTGRPRRRKTSTRVRIADWTARVLITFGGIGTILAVSLVCFFLVWVVVPLFSSPEIAGKRSITRGAGHADDVKPMHVAVDEYQLLTASFFEDGVIETYALADGEHIRQQRLTEHPPALTAAAFTIDGKHFALGFDDGTIQLGEIGFSLQFIDEQQIDDPDVHALDVDETMPYDNGVITRTRAGQLRLSKLAIELNDPVEAENDTGVVAIDLAITNRGPVYAALYGDGELRLSTLRQQRNMMTGTITHTPDSARLPYESVVDAEPPTYLKVAGRGDNVYVAWRDGRCLRFDSRSMKDPQLAEELDLAPGEGTTLTAMHFANGRNTLITGDSQGRVRGWFRIKPTIIGATSDGDALIRSDAVPEHIAERLATPEPADVTEKLRDEASSLRINSTRDGTVLVMAHELAAADPPVTALASSNRSRMIVAGYADGSATLALLTSAEVLATVRAEGAGSVTAVAITPKDDGLLAAQRDLATLWQVDSRHPEASFGSVFTKVWYEGYNTPTHAWQSSSGSDDFEPKFGLMPLIFGTLKATIFCMMFGLPLGLAAAVYSSEFLHPRTKAKVKPTIETMASLPTVVLGFLAALVFAPWVERFLPMVLALVFTIPVALLLGSYLWQLFPYAWFVRLKPYRFIFICAVLPIGMAAAWLIGPAVEAFLFADDLRSWLDGQVHTRLFGVAFGGLGGWCVLLLPLSAITVGLVCMQWVNPRYREFGRHWSRPRAALAELVKFGLAFAAVLLLSLVVGLSLTILGFDPRGSNFFPPDLISTYVQRNALVVGFVMGFAVIPIIYTIADDALSAVPEHLRAGSLATGATPWQTAVRIVIPTAMSGLFSATMIGLGRAVGETMIVLMAAGNTPVMEWNIFNGFRTLSANIAVELPEAPINGTHYRMLFLAALALFAMTFALNTIAEIVRLRFRKRAYQL
ncbi:MAG: ABC transporter permease subunit [bacterium]